MRFVKEWFNRQNEPQPEYRCVIVGAGSGGCVTAYTFFFVEGKPESLAKQSCSGIPLGNKWPQKT